MVKQVFRVMVLVMGGAMWCGSVWAMFSLKDCIEAVGLKNFNDLMNNEAEFKKQIEAYEKSGSALHLVIDNIGKANASDKFYYLLGTEKCDVNKVKDGKTPLFRLLELERGSSTSAIQSCIQQLKTDKVNWEFEFKGVSILELAIECEHFEWFEYFIENPGLFKTVFDKKPKKYLKLLLKYSCLKNNYDHCTLFITNLEKLGDLKLGDCGDVLIEFLLEKASFFNNVKTPEFIIGRGPTYKSSFTQANCYLEHVANLIDAGCKLPTSRDAKKSTNITSAFDNMNSIFTDFVGKDYSKAGMEMERADKVVAQSALENIEKIKTWLSGSADSSSLRSKSTASHAGDQLYQALQLLKLKLLQLASMLNT